MTANTPEEERAVIAAAAARLDADAQEAYAELVELIRGGMVPREAVAEVMSRFQGDLAAAMAAALTAVMAESVGSASVLDLKVGSVSLSARLYQEAAETGEIVQNIVQRHLRGFADARTLARDMYEGYSFRLPDAEPLQITPRGKMLPQYMRTALMSDPGVARDLATQFARLQVNGLATGPLRAAYTAVLDAIKALEDGKGQALLEKRLEGAFFERTRYFAQRIAQTEIHRAFAKRQAIELMADADVEFVQLRRAPGKGDPCICVLYTGRDLYGLGPGVYPKAIAPLPPWHPYCRCVASPRLDLTGKKAKPIDDGEDAYFLRRLGARAGAQVMGSRARLEQVLDGAKADAVYAAGKRVPIQTVGEVV